MCTVHYGSIGSIFYARPQHQVCFGLNSNANARCEWALSVLTQGHPVFCLKDESRSNGWVPICRTSTANTFVFLGNNPRCLFTVHFPFPWDHNNQTKHKRRAQVSVLCFGKKVQKAKCRKMAVCGFHKPKINSGADPGFWPGGPAELWPKGGPEPKICSKWGVSLKKLPENCLILKTSWGRAPRAPWIRHWNLTAFYKLCLTFLHLSLKMHQGRPSCNYYVAQTESEPDNDFLWQQQSVIIWKYHLIEGKRITFGNMKHLFFCPSE